MGGVVNIDGHIRTEPSSLRRLAQAGARLTDDQWRQLDNIDSFEYGFSASLYRNGERHYIDPAEVIANNIGWDAPRRSVPPS